MSNKTEMTFSFVVNVTAKNEELASEMRSEIVGAAEDNTESRNVNAEATCGDLQPGDIEQKLQKYRALHDRVSDLIEDGRFADFKEDDPKAYESLVCAMEELALLDPTPVAELGKKSYSI